MGIQSEIEGTPMAPQNHETTQKGTNSANPEQRKDKCEPAGQHNNSQGGGHHGGGVPPFDGSAQPRIEENRKQTSSMSEKKRKNIKKFHASC